MSLSRTLLGILGVLICGSAIGHQAATAAASPSVSIRRITSLAGRVVAGDFNGDGPIGDNEQITIRVRSLANTNAWGKAGVMIRESVAAGPMHADAIVSPGKGIAMQYRNATNGTTVSAAQVNGAAPVWLRIFRSEPASPGAIGSFQASFSTDGQGFRLLSNSLHFTIAHDAMIGIALTSHTPRVETTAVIDDIRIER